MKPPDAALRELVRQWPDKASVDFSAAEHLAGQSQRFGEVVAFLCQQAAENFLRALLVLHQIEFPKTHDIAKRFGHLAMIDAAMAESLREADQLTPFGVEMRYPGDAPELPPGGEIAAIKTADRVRSAVSGSLQKYLHSDDSE